MQNKRTPEQLRAEIQKFRFWYHKIDLGEGVVTPGLDFDHIWENIRKSRNLIDYKNKIVLDIGSWDGMWAFEAEKLGAKIVIATDCRYDAYENFLFCKEILGSKVMPFYNVSPYFLIDQLVVFFQENWEEHEPNERLFDIVQHLGLLYHLRDPLLTLSQARSCIRTGGYLLIETAAVINDESSFMLFNGIPPQEQRIYPDVTTWWAPTITCLKEMLRASLFEPDEKTICILHREPLKTERHIISRVSLVAQAISPESIDPLFYRELARTYRNPGLALEIIEKY
jgi:tRNA (mo5U34)-methyltransferase